MNNLSLGWIPDVPDIRDITVSDVKNELPRTLDVTPNPSDLPKVVDNRKWCSNIEDQGNLGSCTANSIVSLFEYMENKAGNKHVDGSRLFVYYNSRKYAGFPVSQDTGSYIRSSVKAVVMDGICEENIWQYDVSKFSVEPSKLAYSNAQRFRGTKYIRLDDRLEGLVDRIKSFVNNGYAVTFGFSVYDCVQDISSKVPVLPFPSKGEKLQGGHAVTIVGYDSEAPSRNYRNGYETKGAMLCQNSWSERWGQRGFFYIPFEYFTSQLAMDVWSITSIDYVDSGAFD